MISLITKRWRKIKVLITKKPTDKWKQDPAKSNQTDEVEKQFTALVWSSWRQRLIHVLTGESGKSFYLWNKMGLAKPARIFGTCTEMISPIISGKLTLVWSDWAWTKRSNVNWWSFFTVWNRRRKVIVTVSDVFAGSYRTCYKLPPKRKKVNNNGFVCVFICSVYWTLFNETLGKSSVDEHLQLIVSKWLPRIGTIKSRHGLTSVTFPVNVELFSTQSPDLNPIEML